MAAISSTKSHQNSKAKAMNSNVHHFLMKHKAMSKIKTHDKQQNIFEYRKPMGLHIQNTTAVADSDSDRVSN